MLPGQRLEMRQDVSQFTDWKTQREPWQAPVVALCFSHRSVLSGAATAFAPHARRAYEGKLLAFKSGGPTSLFRIPEALICFLCIPAPMEKM